MSDRHCYSVACTGCPKSITLRSSGRPLAPETFAGWCFAKNNCVSSELRVTCDGTGGIWDGNSVFAFCISVTYCRVHPGAMRGPVCGKDGFLCLGVDCISNGTGCFGKGAMGATLALPRMAIGAFAVEVPARG